MDWTVSGLEPSARTVLGWAMVVVGLLQLASCSADRRELTEPEDVTGDPLLFFDPDPSHYHDPSYTRTTGAVKETVIVNFESTEVGDTTSFRIDPRVPVVGASFGVQDDDSLWIAYPGANYVTLGGAIFADAPSPTHGAQVQRAWAGEVSFDPPVSEVSFLYTSYITNDHTLYAYNEAGWLVASAAAPGNAEGAYLNTWDTVGVALASDVIARIRFSGVGNPAIDDFRFVRDLPPAIVCDTVPRGSPSTCRVRSEVFNDLTGVTGWKSIVDNGSAIDTIFGPQDSTWTGTVVHAAIVSAIGLTNNNDSIPLVGALEVLPRDSVTWRWSEDDWVFVQGAGKDCGQFSKAELPGTIVAGQHLRANYCLNGYIDPPPTGVNPPVVGAPSSPVQVGSISDAGPNDGLWYVESAAFGMDNGSILNPSILPGYTPLDNLHNKDKNVCKNAGNQLQQANFYDYNTLCRGVALSVWYQGLWDHEGYGSGGGNGHESRLRMGATLPQNDPVWAVEPLVELSESAIGDAISGALQAVDGNLITAGDPSHVFVRNNYAPITLWFRQSNNGQFKDLVKYDLP